MDTRNMTDEELVTALAARGNPQVRVIEDMQRRIKELETFRENAIRRFEVLADLIQQTATALQQHEFYRHGGSK